VQSTPDRAVEAVQNNDSTAYALMALHVLAVSTSAALPAFFLFLPASATLACIEAALLLPTPARVLAFARVPAYGFVPA
jgi:hypothetical protein